MSGPEKMRAVALAYKLADLCDGLEKPKEEQEKWLTFGVETVLKNVLEVPGATTAEGAEADAGAKPVQAASSAEEEDNMLIIGELGLPDWVSTVDVAAPLEALGTFYSKAGKLE